jgi:hypothetical protein
MGRSDSCAEPYKEALGWRVAELGREALECFEKNKTVSAILLTRAVMETSAALWYLCARVEAVVESAAVGDFGAYLTRLIMGTATDFSATESNVTDPILPRPIKVGTFIKEVTKDIEEFNHIYGILSEFAHPNWAGTALVYSKHYQEDRCTRFGQNIRDEGAKDIGPFALSGALMMFERSQKRIDELMPKLIAVCERKVKANE